MKRQSIVFSLLLAMVTLPVGVFATECSLEQGYSADYLLQSKEAAELAEATKRQIIAFEKFINSRKWENGKPMSEQMTVAEAGEFGKHQKQSEISILKQMFESRRERDLQVIRKLAILADKIYRYGFDDGVNDDQKSEDFFLAGILLSARKLVAVDLQDLSKQAVGSCNLEMALGNLARDAVDEFERSNDYAATMREAEKLSKVYGMPIVIEKLSATDRDRYVSVLLPKLSKIGSLLARAEDLYRFALIENTSKKMLAALRQDQYESPGDQEYSGTTWARWEKEGRVSARENTLSQILNYINEKIPSNKVNEFNARSKNAEK